MLNWIALQRGVHAADWADALLDQNGTMDTGGVLLDMTMLWAAGMAARRLDRCSKAFTLPHSSRKVI